MNRSSHMPFAWLRLLLGLGLIYTFCFWLVPTFCQQAPIRPLMEYIEEEELDAGALFYTESPEAGEVEFYWRNGEGDDKQK